MPPRENREAPKVMYQAGSQALCHYSNCLMHLRSTTLAQGFAVAGAAGYLVTRGYHGSPLFVLLFGLLLTWLLWLLQQHYLRLFMAHGEPVKEFERQLLQASAPTAETPPEGTWLAYFAVRERSFARWQGRYEMLVVHGPSLLMFLALLSVLIYLLSPEIGAAWAKFQELNNQPIRNGV